GALPFLRVSPESGIVHELVSHEGAVPQRFQRCRAAPVLLRQPHARRGTRCGTRVTPWTVEAAQPCRSSLPNPCTTCSASSAQCLTRRLVIDRKSTRLNSSHVKISYAVFCLKKKKTKSR